jgi:hypothetical protein
MPSTSASLSCTPHAAKANSISRSKPHELENISSSSNPSTTTASEASPSIPPVEFQPGDYQIPEKFGQLRWPSEFYVVDIIEGLQAYEGQIGGNKTQPEVFLSIFGVPCVRETLRLKLSFLENIKVTNKELLDNFIEHGRVHAVRWVYFETWALGTKLCGKKRLEILALSSASSKNSRYLNHIYLLLFLFNMLHSAHTVFNLDNEELKETTSNADDQSPTDDATGENKTSNGKH